MKLLSRYSLIAAFSLFGAGLMSAQVATKPALSLALAKKVAAVAQAEAAKNKWTVVIAIVDEGGSLVYLEKMDGTQLGSIDVAQGKAATALRFKRPTKVFEDAVVGGRTPILSLPGVVAVEGGLPIVVDGAFIGAIGISGAKSNEDGIVAQAALAAVAAK